MPNVVRIVGVHEIEADEPVHLIEIEFASDAVEFDFGEVTQAIPNVDRDNWQSAYDEREIDSASGTRRFAFFFHYLDVSFSLFTSFGEIQIPASTPFLNDCGQSNIKLPDQDHADFRSLHVTIRL